ncbi:MAG TPA: DNA polymerase III subunit gamma/tau, partial [Pseudonocardia sp.]|nr:DNA polymerase III subunit gamma/tau [Pseudonocardia sp.]
TAPRLLLELLCGRMLLPAASTTDLALLQRLERMERRADIVVEPRPDGVAEALPSAAPSAPATPPAPAPSVQAPPSSVQAPAAPAEAGPAASGQLTRTFQRRSRAPESSGGAAEAPAEPPAVASTRAESLPPPPVRATAPAPSHAPEPPAAPPAAAPRTEAAAEVPAAPPPAGSPGSGGIDAAAVRRAWPSVLDAAKQSSRSTGALLVNATVKAVEGDTLVLTIAAAPLARRLSEQRNTEVISAALRSVLGVAWQVRCDHDGGGAPAGRAPAAPSGGAPPAAKAAPTAPAPAASPPPPPPPARRPAASVPSGSEPPLPPEPPPYEDEEEMPDEPVRDLPASQENRRDPEDVAIELLSAQLGARALEDRR